MSIKITENTLIEKPIVVLKYFNKQVTLKLKFNQEQNSNVTISEIIHSDPELDTDQTINTITLVDKKQIKFVIDGLTTILNQE